MGHLDLIERAAHLFDRLHVGVLNNPAKTPFFEIGERVEMLQIVTAHLPNVVCEPFAGLAAEFARKSGAQAIVRGLRAVSDFEVEFKMAAMNRHLQPDVETLFMVPSNSYAFISSSVIREVAGLGGDVASLVPEVVYTRLRRRFSSEEGKEEA